MSQKDSWIRRFISMDGNDFICEVDRDFIQDKFNLTDLDEQIPFYREALRIILDNHEDPAVELVLTCSTDDDSASHRKQYDKIQLLSSAEKLYGLIHARFILTDPGLHKMKEKYTQQLFGRCTRVYCEKAAVLPIGLSDCLGHQPVKLYCPRCMDIYSTHLTNSSKYVQTDGAFFGTNFPQMFFMVYPELRPSKPTEKFVPKLYGFQIHKMAHEYQLQVSSNARMAKSCIRLLKRGNTNGEANCSLAAKNGNASPSVIQSVTKNSANR